MIKISPSLLAADPCCLGAEVQKALDCHADELHYDVMDAHFVPNLSFGPHILAGLKKKIDIPYDVHLMVTDPLNCIQSYIDAGAVIITVHAEANEPAKAMQKIREAGLQAGISIKPGTPVEAIRDLLPLADRVLLMTVEPGFGGQKLMPEVLVKARELRALGFQGDIEADGGINPDNAQTLVECGINVLVMGTAFFKSNTPQQVVDRVHALLQSLS